MTTGNQFLDLFIAGLLGVLAHVFFVKLPAVRKRSLAANKPFVASEYFKDEWVALIGSIITVVICVFIVDEIVGYNPSLMRFIKGLFVFVGYTGSSLLIALFGVADKAILKVVDKKTDIADSKP